MREELESKEKELFVVVSSEVGKLQSWLLVKSSYCNSFKENETEILQLKDVANSEGLK